MEIVSITNDAFDDENLYKLSVYIISLIKTEISKLSLYERIFCPRLGLSKT